MALLFGWLTSVAMGVSVRDRRAVMIEGGMQNSAFAGHHRRAVQRDLGMVIIASLWGSGTLSAAWLRAYWRRSDARSATSRAGAGRHRSDFAAALKQMASGMKTRARTGLRA